MYLQSNLGRLIQASENVPIFVRNLSTTQIKLRWVADTPAIDGRRLVYVTGVAKYTFSREHRLWYIAPPIRLPWLARRSSVPSGIMLLTARACACWWCYLAAYIVDSYIILCWRPSPYRCGSGCTGPCSAALEPLCYGGVADAETKLLPAYFCARNYSPENFAACGSSVTEQ